MLATVIRFSPPVREVWGTARRLRRLACQGVFLGLGEPPKPKNTPFFHRGVAKGHDEEAMAKTL